MRPQRHVEHGGGARGDGVLDLSVNLNTVSFSHTGRYPDPDRVRAEKRVAEWLGLEPESVAIVPGATWFIHRVMPEFTGERPLIIEPSFSEVQRALALRHRPVSLYDRTLERYPRIVRSVGPTAAVLTVPAAHTGSIIGGGAVRSLETEVNGPIFIDESFMFFTGLEGYAKRASSSSGTVAFRSLTKVLARPEMRLAIVTSGEEFLEAARMLAEPWSLSEEAVDFLLKVPLPDLDGLSLAYRELRERLVEGLERMGMRVIGRPSANYLSFSVPAGITAERFRERMLSLGIAVRRVEIYGAEAIRMAVPDAGNLDRVMDALRRSAGGGS